MPGISALSRVGLATLLAALLLCGLLLAGLGADGASAGPLQCSFRSVKPTETGKRLDAKGRMRCTGSGTVKRQTLKVCLMQKTEARYVEVKCVTHALSGPGLVTGTAARICASGPAVDFISRIQIRVRLSNGSLQKAQTDSSKGRFPRNCGG